MEIFANILPSTFYDDIVQWLAFGFNIIYVILASRENAWCWVWGFFGTIFQGIVCFDANLKSDTLLQIYYSFSAIYGWYNWQMRKRGEPKLSVSSIPLSYHAGIFLLGLTLSIPLSMLWDSAAFRYEDAILTCFSVITTLLTARKIIESWLYWVVIDFSYSLIYFERDKYLLALLSIIYFLFSIKGYFSWRSNNRVVSSMTS